MSLIGSTRDALQDIRKKSLSQEQHIDRNRFVSHWRMSGDATKVSLVERALGCAVLPVVFFWGLLVFAMSIAIGIFLAACRLLSRLFR